VTKPEPLSLKLLSDVSALIVPALIVTAGESCDTSSSSTPVSALEASKAEIVE
jgi:hypothetical protein